ncbi:MAG: hypothetical protein M3Z05_03415 [Gemmatimonadota bacterium]|nr:hypothetical protein [Gemmatimonadota bacterium]
MRRIFTLGVIGLLAVEIANVYFIMPMPGSQQMRSIDAAYAVYRPLLSGICRGACCMVGYPAA